MKKLLIIVGLAIPVSLGGIYAFNYFGLQSKMNKVLSSKRNKGIEVSVHYEKYVKTSVLIFDLKKVSADKAPIDVFRVFLQFAEKVKSKAFKKVKLQYKGETKFYVTGDYFQKLGKEYEKQNPAYTVRTFPENLKNPDGSRAYPKWEGGILGVLKKQMEDFMKCHKKWYINDMKK